MKRRFQCFNCGLIEEREDGNLYEPTSQKDESQSNEDSDGVSKGSGKKTREPIKCSKCGESKWIPLKTEKELKQDRSKKRAISRWDRITSILSRFAVSILVFWKQVELHRRVLLNRVVGFLGVLLGVYLVDSWFQCGFDKAAVFMLLLYLLFKWR